MFNMIKMDLYRMFRTKSMYVIWAILLGLMLSSACMSATMDTEDMVVHQTVEEEGSEPINVGMSVTLPTEPGQEVTIFDEFFANAQSKAIGIFMAIFAVLFSTADLNCGYIKNIGGQVKNRGKLVLSKAICLAVYSVMTIVVAVLGLTVVTGCLYGEIRLGNMADFGRYVLVQTALNMALVMISMGISILLRNNVISMAIVICLCMNLSILIYAGIETLIRKIGFENFELARYTVTGRISMLSNTPGNKECVEGLVIAVVFGLVATLVASKIFRCRDI